MALSTLDSRLKKAQYEPLDSYCAFYVSPWQPLTVACLIFLA